MAYTVTAVKDEARPWGDGMKEYRVHLRDSENVLSQNVEISRHQTKPAPTVGEVIEGNLDQGKYGLKFKEARKGGAGGGRAFGKSPAEQASIAASVALDKALIAVEQAGTLGLIKVDSIEAHAAAVDWYFDRFFGWIDKKAKAA
jgi:hypothetical protein